MATNSMIESAAKSLPKRQRNELPVLLVTLPLSQKQRRLAVTVIIAVGIAFLITLPYATISLRRVDTFVPTIQGMLFVFDLIIAVLLFAQYSVVPQLAILAIANGYLFTALMVAAQALTFPGAFTPSGLFGAGLQSANWLYYFWFTGFPLATIFYVTLKNVSMYRKPSWVAAGLSISVTLAVAAGLTWIATTGEKLLPSILLDEVRFGPVGAYCSSIMLLVSVLALTLLWIKQRTLLDLWLAVGIVVALPSIVVPIIVPFARFNVAWYSSRIYAVLGAGIMMIALFTEVFLLHVRVVRSNMMLERERESKLMNALAIVAAIAHEVRQPLTRITSGANAAQRFLKMTPPEQDKAQTALEGIVNAGHSTSKVIDGFRSLFDKADEEQELVNMNELVPEVLEECDSELKDYGVLIRVDLTPKLPPVTGNRSQLQEVLYNLIINSVEAMETTTVEGRLLLIRTEIRGDKIAVTVENSGPGIDNDRLGDFFTAFDTTKRQGMGLGLAISRMIIDYHGGKLTASSDGKDGGASFQFVLPIA